MGIEKLGITPGPWKGLHGDGIDRRGNKHIYAADPYGQVCVVDKTVRDEENSAVIAAAPEMLEALIENALFIEKEGVGWDLWGNIDLIQKATGKPWEEIKELMK